MRQVPQHHYLLIGNGRIARHFQHYFSLLKLNFDTWHRQQPPEKLHQLKAKATHILLLINDDAIEAVIDEHALADHALLVHCSGSLVSNKAIGAHPLMSFSINLYSLTQYQSIPFIIDHSAPDFENLLPGLPNQHVRLHTSLKEKYHALCVLSGNFSCLLWQKLFASFENELSIPAEIAYPYLQQQTHNLLTDYTNALTGPLVRNDVSTIQRNLAALHADPFQAVYENFVTCYQNNRTRGTL